MKSRLKPSAATMTLYLLPSALVYIGIFVVPILLAIYFSFFDFKTINVKTFIGLRNFRRLLVDRNVLGALWNNLYLVAVNLAGQVGIAFVLANMLHSRLIRPRVANFYRTVIYFPVTLSAIVIGYVWLLIYDYHFGLLNWFLTAVGRGDAVRAWLGEADGVMTCVSIPMIWQYVGFHLIIIMSAMTAIDPGIYEMASIDGASGFRQAMSITFPLISKTLGVCVILCVSANMKAFDHIVAMTNGGPGYKSTVLALYAYRVSFTQNNLGYGNAISVAIMVVMLLILGATRGLGKVASARIKTLD